MRHRVFALLACGLFPAVASAQVAVGVGVGAAPGWSYPGLPGGPYVTYPYAYPYAGWPGFHGAHGSFWTNGLSLYGPPVPVYGPIPGVFGANDLNRQWRERPTLGWGVGWVGVYGAKVHSHRPATVNVWPRVESVSAAPAVVSAPAAQPGGSLIVSVKVPQPAAEVFVDGQKTMLTGTDRTFESPSVEAGKDIRYELTARWVERGATVERKKVVTGKPGEVVRVDFTVPDAVVGR